jgi:transcriptional regulator with PAS, ATPase and Fis domain
VLQDKVVYRVGEHQPHKVDVRILAATNKNLETLIEKGEFREDLYYRINVIPLSLPPLRERTDDIPLLVRHFASRFAKEQDKPAPVFDDRVLNMFQTYAWPGNVRELENVVQRLVVMTERDVITAPELPELMRFSALQGGVQRSLAQVEAEHIHAVLASVEDNKTLAAKILGIDRKTLQSKLKA